MNFADLLRLRVQNHGEDSIKEQAASVGISWGTLFRWMRGANIPDTKLLPAAAELSGCTVDQVLMHLGKPKLRRVIIETPYMGDTAKNVAYARACLLDCLNRGESAIASHLLWAQVTSDNDIEARTNGIEAGYVWWLSADAIVFYTDLGSSDGVDAAMELANRTMMLVELRALPPELMNRVLSGDSFSSITWPE